MAGGAGGIDAVLLKALTEIARELLLALERRHVFRRGGRRRAEDLFEDPLAALHGGRAVGVGRRRQDARLGEDAAAFALGQGHPDEIAGTARFDVADPIQFGEGAVEVGEVRVDDVEDAAILAHDLGQEQFRLPHHRSAQGVIELREHLRVGRHQGQAARLQPLQAEAGHQVLGALVLEQTRRLRLEVGGELAGVREGE